MLPELIDVRQAALEAGRSAETIRRWIWSGRLPARRRGRKLMVERGHLRTLAERPRAATAATLGAWIQEVETDPIFAGAPRRPSSSDLVLEDRRDHAPGEPRRARR